MVRVGRGTARMVGLPVVLVVMISLSGVVLGRVYAGPLLTRLVVGAAIGSVLVSVAARRLPSWLVAPLSVAGLAGYGALAMRLAAREAGLAGDLAGATVEAARNGIPRLLTALIPVEAAPDTVVVPLVAAWLAGLAGAEVAVRAGRVLAGYLPPVLCYVGVLYVVGPNAGPAFGPTLVFAAVAAVGLALSPGPAGDASGAGGEEPVADGGGTWLRIRMAATTAAGVIAVVVVATLLGPVVAARVSERPVDPRRYVQPPQVEMLDENPLIRISGWALHPEQKLLEVRTGSPGRAPASGPTEPSGSTAPSGSAPASGPTEPSAPGPGRTDAPRIRLAVLPDYDGVTWRVGATYRNAGRVLPPVTPVADRRFDTVRQEITVDGLSGRLLPAVATPQEVDGARVAYDADTGTLIHPDGLRPGLRYTVTSAHERPDANLLPTANVPAGPQVARVLQVADGVPDALRRLAEQLAADNGAPYSRAAAIEQFLAEHYRLVADAPSGHAYPNLNFFLFGPRHGGGQRGTSEQFAAAFAVLGRLTGLPTRVVVGFSAPPGGAGPVRAADAYAWPEVLFEDLGWVAFDPLPQPRTEPRPVEEDLRPKPEEPPPSEAPAPTVEPTPSATVVVAPPVRSDGTAVPLLAVGTAGLVLVTALLLTVVVLLRIRQQRRRLTTGPPDDRIAGAWREVTDALRLAGRPVADNLSASEIAARAQRSVAERGPATEPGPVTELARLVNAAAFAPGQATDAQAVRAAALARTYVSVLRTAQPWWRRLWWRVHPGPLRWTRARVPALSAPEPGGRAGRSWWTVRRSHRRTAPE